MNYILTGIIFILSLISLLMIGLALDGLETKWQLNKTIHEHQKRHNENFPFTQ